jgi:hypothetical protein
VTLRAGSSFVTFVVVAAAMVLLLGSVLLRGSWTEIAHFGGPVVLVVWVAWLLLVRPSIRIEQDRAVVVNVGRIIEVPWARTVDVRRRLQLILDLDDGRRVECWGSPFPRRRMVGREPQTTEDDPALAAVRSAWMSWQTGQAPAAGEGRPVIRRMDTTALAIGAGAVVLAAIGLIS